MATIYARGGVCVLIDDQDLPLVLDVRWSLNGAGYVQSRLGLLHRVITGAQKGEVVDHINGDITDNRRCNLRLCRQSQNGANRRKAGNTSSQYKGVTWRKDTQKWMARITSRQTGRLISLGCFEDEIEAAKEYDEAARAQYGEFARCNFEVVT